MKLRPWLLVATCLLLASPAFAAPVPELDSSQLGTGIALAAAVLLVLSDRRRARSKPDADSDPIG